MRPFRPASNRTRFEGIDLPLLFFLLILPLQWKGSLSVDLGIFLLGVGQIPSWFLLLIGFLRPLTFVAFFRLAPLFNTLFIAFYAVLGLSILWSHDLGGGVLVYRPNLRSLLFYFALGAYLTRCNVAQLCRTVSLAAPLSVLVFIMYGAYTVQMTPVDELDPEIRKLNPRIILLNMINYSPEKANLERDDDEFETTTVKNLIAAGFNVLLYLFLICGTTSGRRLLNPITILALMLYPVVIFALLSRSNFLALCAGMGVVVVLYQVSPRISSRQKLFSVVCALLVLLLFGSLASVRGGYIEDFMQVQAGKYEEAGSDVRFPHYVRAYKEIARSPLFGYGIGARVSDGFAVHNLFLGAWFQMGLLGFILSVAYYMTLVYYFVRCCLRAAFVAPSPDFPLNPFWLPGLLVIPMLRALIIGGYGQFQSPDVAAVAFFIWASQTAWTRPAEPAISPEASPTNPD
ncbi:O-antigen ligase domain-containing protein [bacterium CPR1]|nr:O-antigen ligase domain-containing protein [bacterium CPR1]